MAGRCITLLYVCTFRSRQSRKGPKLSNNTAYPSDWWQPRNLFPIVFHLSAYFSCADKKAFCSRPDRITRVATAHIQSQWRRIWWWNRFSIFPCRLLLPLYTVEHCISFFSSVCFIEYYINVNCGNCDFYEYIKNLCFCALKLKKD